MEVKLTTEQEAYLVQLAARTSRSKDEAIREAVTDWVERQTALVDFRATLDEAEASIGRGEGIEITPASMQTLADDVKKRRRERLSARRSALR